METFFLILNFPVGNNTSIKRLRLGSCVLMRNLMAVLRKLSARL